MIALLMSVCLAAAPDRCRQVEMQFSEEGVTQMQCLMSAPAIAAKYIDEHPGYVLSRWSCEVVDRSFAKI